MIRGGDDFQEARDKIREIVDFPKPGILFRDITPLLADARIMGQVIDRIGGQWSDSKIDVVVSPESRGFIFGAAVAHKLGAAFVPVRKPGALPYKCIQVRYEMEYRSDLTSNTLHMHEDALHRGARVLIVDDLLATGGTAWACKVLSETLGATVAGAAFVIELTSLKGREKIKDLAIQSLLIY